MTFLAPTLPTGNMHHALHHAKGVGGRLPAAPLQETILLPAFSGVLNGPMTMTTCRTVPRAEPEKTASKNNTSEGSEV